jgi:LPPG:FO 2-phospho-L-lactate transferase
LITASKNRVVALSGGIGGAKLALGLSRVLAPGDLTVIANSGDDFEHLGLAISPDIDTVMYTLAGLANPNTGWGRRDETWTFMNALCQLGGETWFQLGDGDLATHVERTRRLKAGETLSAITADFCCRLGITTKILPMSDDKVRTRVRTADGVLDFQDYFVGKHCEPVVEQIMFEGADTARALPEFLAALADPGLRAVIICPSNPFISIDPILALPKVRQALIDCQAPVIAVSPIIGGKAVKGPTAKMMIEMGLTPSAMVTAEHYHDLLDGYVLDNEDAEISHRLDLPTFPAQTLMVTLADREALARHVLVIADALGNRA